MKAIRNNVVVKPFFVSDISEGGIFIPDTIKKESDKVLIVSVGKGTAKNAMKLKENTVGYRVKEWGTPVIENDELYYIMDASAIIALG